MMKNLNFCIILQVYQFLFHVRALIQILTMSIIRRDLPQPFLVLIILTNFLVLLFSMLDLFFLPRGLNLMFWKQKCRRKISRRDIERRRENRESLSPRNLQRKIKEPEQRSTRSVHLATDLTLHHQMIQFEFKVLPQRNPHLGRIQVLIRYFKFNFIWCCVVPTIHNLLLVLWVPYKLF